MVGILGFGSAASAHGGRDWGSRGHGHDVCHSKHCGHGKKSHRHETHRHYDGDRYREAPARTTVVYRDRPVVRPRAGNDITIIYRGGWD